MRRLTWRNLVARKLRLLMSAFAIVLGIAFLSGSLIFTDTIERSFNSIIYDTVSDVTIRPAGSTPESASINTSGTGISSDLVDQVAGLEGVDRADGQVQGIGLFVVTKENKLLGGTGAPTLTFNWGDTPNAAGEQIATIGAGRPPSGPDEVAIDARSAQRAGYTVGDTVRMVTTEENPQREARLVGIVEFGAGSLAGATLVVFDTPTAQQIFFDGRDEFNTVTIATTADQTQTDVAERVNTLLADSGRDDLEAMTGEDVAAESQDLLDTVMGFLGTFLLVFAGVALVVGTFLIVNTFSILVAQRSRELALLRALGASRRQVTRSVLLEAFVVGLIGSTAGILAGFGLAALLKFIFGFIGLDLSGAPLVFQPTTVIVSYATGVLVTMFAAYLPARRAAKIPPVAAMRDDIAMPTGSLIWRAVLAVLGGVLGAVGLTAGLFFDVPRPIAWVGGGVFFVLMAVAAASPLLAMPLLAVFRLGYRAVFGSIGHLAAENARRNPRRTAATASALMIGLALVTTMAILGSSINRTIDKGVEEQFTSDFLVSNVIGQPFTTSIADRAREIDGVEQVAQMQSVWAQAPSGDFFAIAADSGPLEQIFTIPWLDGRAPQNANEIAMLEESAQFHGVDMGGTISVTTSQGARELTLVGLYDETYVLGNGLFDDSFVEAAGMRRMDSTVAITVADDVGVATMQRQLESLVADIPTVAVQNQQDFAETQRAQVNTLLYLIYALLGLAIIIAILGIINTLSLSVIERTREIGLLRAVGMKRNQLSRMVLLESVAIAILGALLGVGAGLLFGISLRESFADDGIEYLAIPAGQLSIFIVVSALVGVIAAIMPAWRASRLDVLKAISTE